jgi:geranylgeranyl diphosphate synthase type II
MSFEDAYIKNRQRQIRTFLAKLFPPQQKVSRKLFQAMRYLLSQKGKLIRPILTIAICEALGKNYKSALAPACAIELLHTYTLIHDDLPCMDDSDTRRGKPSTHKVFGEAVATLAGNALQSLAFETLSRFVKKDKLHQYITALAKFTGCQGTLSGQTLDLEGCRDINKVFLLKTSCLFECAALFGGICADASPEIIKRIARYGRFLGLAFQFVDDILDFRAKKREPVNAARILGVKEAKRRAQKYIKMAKRQITFLKNKAQILHYICEMVLRNIKDG